MTRASVTAPSKAAAKIVTVGIAWTLTGAIALAAPVVAGSGGGAGVGSARTAGATAAKSSPASSTPKGSTPSAAKSRPAAAPTAPLPTSVAAAAGTSGASSTPLRAIAIAEDERRWPDGVLRGYLAHADAGVRRRAVLAVGRLQDSTSVPALTPLLADPDVGVRHETAFALGQVGHRSARAALESALDGGDRGLAQLAIEALGKLGDPAATPRVVAALRDPTPALRGEAAVALWRLADSTAVDALIAATNDPNAGVRWRSLYALEKLVMPDRVVLRVALQLEHPDPLVRAYAVRTLGRQKSPRATAYVLGKIGDPDPGVAVNAVRALTLIADTTCAPCAPTLLEPLASPNPWLRVTAATAFADRWVWARQDSATRARFATALREALGDPDPATRGAAARALLVQVGAGERAGVARLLDDSSVYVRTAVMQGLRGLPAAEDAAVRELLLPRLAPSHHLFDRMTAAEVLGGRKDALPTLRAGLADSSTLYVAAIAGALAEAGDSVSVRALARAYAARAADADADARLSIRDALRQLAGRPFADSVERAHPARNATPSSYAPDFQDPPAVRGAVIHTTRGDIEWAFDAAMAPQTVRNFVRLADRGYFDGTAFHRVVPNFVIQDGDPSGTGSGGPGYTIRCEYNSLRYDAGMVGMALSGKDTGGSQWFITHAPQPHLNGRYTIFAHVVRGMDVVNRIVQGDRIGRVEVLR